MNVVLGRYLRKWNLALPTAVKLFEFADVQLEGRLRLFEQRLLLLSRLLHLFGVAAGAFLFI